MKRSPLIAVLLAFMAFANNASAYYHPEIGRFMNCDPGPARVGSGQIAAGRQFAPRDPTGTNQYADGANLYQYVGSNPVVKIDPTGLWWAGSHATLTVESNSDSLNFNGPGLSVIVAANLFTDFGKNKLKPSFHYMRAPDEGRMTAAYNSLMTMAGLRDKIIGLAQQCRTGKYDKAAGRQSLVYLGTLLHIVQDVRAHDLMTMAEHGLSKTGQPLPPISESLQKIYEIDTPYSARGARNYPSSLADTKTALAGIKNGLAGWTTSDYKCCLEEVFESYGQALQVLYDNAITPTEQLP